jgi:hypothetical protein
MPQPIDKNELQDAMLLACRWLTEIAQVKTETIPDEDNTRNHRHHNWRGAIRGEYSVAERQWGFFCPIWHTGQAVKALVAAYRVTGEKQLLASARSGASFIGSEQNQTEGDDDFGLIHAYEDFGDKINVSAILETLDGLFALADATGEQCYEKWALDALHWIARKAYLPGEGEVRDVYDPAAHCIVEVPSWTAGKLSQRGRPLLDDAVFLTGFERSGEESLRRIFFEIAERLLATEAPPGNWIGFGPCDPQAGNIHPRHAYWWGKPMLRAWQSSGDEKYLHCARRAADWYVQALRTDGGIIRNTYRDFNTDSFGHATSGTACAAILFQEYSAATGTNDYAEPTQRALNFCQTMQLHSPRDPNLTGVILEKVLPPDGTDRHPYYVRDLGTIFFVQAAATFLLRSL